MRHFFLASLLLLASQNLVAGTLRATIADNINGTAFFTLDLLNASGKKNLVETDRICKSPRASSKPNSNAYICQSNKLRFIFRLERFSSYLNLNLAQLRLNVNGREKRYLMTCEQELNKRTIYSCYSTSSKSRGPLMYRFGRIENIAGCSYSKGNRPSLSLKLTYRSKTRTYPLNLNGAIVKMNFNCEQAQKEIIRGMDVIVVYARTADGKVDPILLSTVDGAYSKQTSLAGLFPNRW